MSDRSFSGHKCVYKVVSVRYHIKINIHIAVLVSKLAWFSCGLHLSEKIERIVVLSFDWRFYVSLYVSWFEEEFKVFLFLVAHVLLFITGLWIASLPSQGLDCISHILKHWTERRNINWLSIDIFLLGGKSEDRYFRILLTISAWEIIFKGDSFREG